MSCQLTNSLMSMAASHMGPLCKSPFFVLLLLFSARSSAGVLRPLPEYAATKSVIISSEIFSAEFNGYSFVREIIAANAEVWIMVPDDSSEALAREGLHKLLIDPRTKSKIFWLKVPHKYLWVRDFGPIPLVKVVKDHNSLVDIPKLLLGDAGYPDPPHGDHDAVPGVIALLMGLPTKKLKITMDGGNFLAGEKICLTSTTDLPLTSDALSKTLAQEMGCSQTVVLSRSPHNHIDMWIKLLPHRQVMVSEIDQKSLDAARQYYGGIPEEFIALRDNLNAQAKILARYLKVVRLPMPLPFRSIFRSFTNSILVNGHAIIPSYQKVGWGHGDYPDASLRSYYEGKVTKAYENSGYQVSFVNSDNLIFNGGALHCATVNIPKITIEESKPRH